VYRSPLITVKVSLALRNVNGISAGNLEEVAGAIVVHVLRLSNGRFQGMLIPQSVQSSILLDLMVMDGVNLLATEKDWL
jgi:hypothetical protein